MQRTLFTRAAAASRYGARRTLSSARSTQSSSSARWIVPSSIIAAGVATYHFSQPLALDAKKPAVPKSEVKEAKLEKETSSATEEKNPETSEEKPAAEGEQEQSAAYNPETGEINWDCPCLGGMAHGPCGEEFKEAFSCFVFSESEPKGFDCIEKFKNMQNCFRRYPDVYSEEIRGDEEPVEDFKTENAPKEEAKAVSPGATAVEVPKSDVIPVVETASAETAPAETSASTEASV